MIEQVECPCCDFRAEIEIDQVTDPRDFGKALRDHVLWTHYRTDDWGKAPSGQSAAMLMLAIGVLEEEEASRAFGRAWTKETPRPSWLARYGHVWLFACVAFGLGSFEGYIWGMGGQWWIWLIAASSVCLWPLLSYIAHRRVWKGHPSAKSLEQLNVPDTIPED